MWPRRRLLSIALMLLACISLLGLLARPRPTTAQRETTPVTLQNVVIDPQNSPRLTPGELSAQLSAAEPGQPVAVQLHLTHTLSGQAPLHPAGKVIDHWSLQIAEDFEGLFPQPLCQVFDSYPDGKEYLWDDERLRAAQGHWSAWPAGGGANALDPAHQPYPNHASSWLVCGPFDLSQMDEAFTRFSWWLDIPDPDEYLLGLCLERRQRLLGTLARILSSLPGPGVRLVGLALLQRRGRCRRGPLAGRYSVVGLR
jgi:hypothetical protein